MNVDLNKKQDIINFYKSGEKVFKNEKLKNKFFKNFIKHNIVKDPDLLKDRDILLIALNSEYLDINYITPIISENYSYPDYSNDKEIIMKTINIEPKWLMIASERLQNDKEVVMAAVKKNGICLKYASNELQNDPEIVLAAVKNKRQALQFASPELMKNKKIYSTAFKNDIISKYIYSFYIKLFY